ncbi:hypothetical protein [Shewanella sp. FJAT-52076]|uniref:hypothetical protein n=1 Tax=Shewanella sp. FJAT-52076 TaxID=2864202 RepID=UPI0021AC8CB8|nr:hypothetical protein [Shewanella sp. FJAT-52076]
MPTELDAAPTDADVGVMPDAAAPWKEALFDGDFNETSETTDADENEFLAVSAVSGYPAKDGRATPFDAA